MTVVRYRLLLLGLTALAFAPLPDARASEAAVLRVRAARLAGEDRCQEALPLLRRARELAPDDARAALLEGQCWFHEKRYDEAVPALEAAGRLDPDSGEAPLLLGIAQYHRGDLAAAEAELSRAEELLPERAELSLYRGLVLLEEARLDEAAARFDRAAELGRGELEPAASYYAGLAHAGAGQRREAEQALARVGRLAPDSEWQRLADEALASPVDRHRLRGWLVARGGFEYDSNVALRGADVSLPADISNEDDGRFVWGVDGGTEIFRNANWGAGILARYQGSAQFSESDFDDQYIGTSLWIDRRLGERTTARFQPEFGAGFLGYDDYLRFYGALAELLHDWGRAGVGRVYTRYAYNDYLYPILGGSALQRRRNRDGHSVVAGYDHTQPLRPGTVLRGGVFYSYYNSDGREYRYNGGGGWLGVRQDLPWGFAFDARGSVAVAEYRYPSSFRMPGEGLDDRSDLLGASEVRLERRVGQRVTATARWLYYNSDSNTRVFDYDRHIVGMYVTIAFRN